MPDVPAWNPKFRKRKKHQGSSWVPERESAAVDVDGAYCVDCRKRHGYMNGLNIQYEKQGKQWHILWTCKKSGVLCRDMPLGETNVSNISESKDCTT